MHVQTVNPYFVFLSFIDGVLIYALRLLRKVVQYVCCASKESQNLRNDLYNKETMEKCLSVLPLNMTTIEIGLVFKTF